jgi:hypothetical protein
MGAFYFTVATLTTTGFATSLGEVLFVVIKVFGVGLLLHLLQALRLND